MIDEVPEIVVGSVIVLTVLGCCLLVGSCVQDYRTSTPQIAEVLIVDKAYSPEHYDQDCSTDDKGYTHCTQVYVPPSWTIRYADERNWTVSVSRGTYDAIRIGERKVLRFDLGGGYWRARYNEQFQFGPVAGEVMPPR